jgi:hypothetical protein
VPTKSASIAALSSSTSRFKLGARVERLLVHVPDHLLGGLSPIGTLVGPLDGGDDVASEVAGEIGRLMSAST